MRILLIEDNDDLAATIFEYLELEGHEMDAAADGVTGLHLAVVNDYDAIILDLNLPGIDGLDVCRRLRVDARSTVAVLMLTARDALEAKLEGFEAGADDYLVKPFALPELKARLGALERRGRRRSGRLQVADLVLDLDTLEISRAGKVLTLTRSETSILRLLMERSPTVVKRSELEHLLWGDQPPDGDVLRSHIHGVRKAVDRAFDNNLVHTVHGVGYRIAAP